MLPERHSRRTCEAPLRAPTEAGGSGGSSGGSPCATQQRPCPLPLPRDRGGGRIGVVDQQTRAVTSIATPSPRVVTVDSKGNVYVVQSGGNVIERIDPGGLVTNLPGSVAAPKRIGVDAEDNLIIADTGSDRVRRYVFGGGIVLIAGGLSRPHGVFEDQMRRMYIADSGNNRVVRIEAEAIASPRRHSRDACPETVTVDTGLRGGRPLTSVQISRNYGSP